MKSKSENEIASFHEGALEMFNYVSIVIANIDDRNKAEWVQDIIEDALEDISPDNLTKIKDLHKVMQRNQELEEYIAKNIQNTLK